MSYCTVCDQVEEKPKGRCPGCGRNYGPSFVDEFFNAEGRASHESGTASLNWNKPAPSAPASLTPESDAARLWMPVERSGKHSVVEVVESTTARSLERRLRTAEAERDLAIAHDTQAYPTAWAYEQVCAALAQTKAELAASRADADKWERLYVAAQNANSYRQDAIDGLENNR